MGTKGYFLGGRIVV